jgi:asparagine synthase (glutamine-hydrolysing)
MCGICGKVNFEREKHVPAQLLKRMADAIRHRGPDDEGFYASGPVGLGFRRLSIIDLDGGHQPLSNENGTVWIVFNGEIYNYVSLREDLLGKGHVFKTKSDTEVIVHLYEEYGPECLQKLRGMFGFAIWDLSNNTLFLARDRVGIKPLYYYVGRDFISFGSEMKAILADPAVSREVDPEIIDRFLTYYYVPGGNTLLRNLFKLEPGHSLTVRNGRIEIQQYWDLDFSRESDNSSIESEKQLVELLDNTVNLHMISDVPVGFLLSGGLDSTAMLSFAARKTDKPISTFTVGFSSPDVIDERPFARLAAERFGSKHYEISMSPGEFVDFLPKYVWHMEEPVVEPPAIALFYVSKLASSHVKVLISGEGGDEAFAGYENFRNLFWFERFKKAIGPLRIPAGGAISKLGELLDSRILLKYGPLMKSEFANYYFSRTSNPFQYFNRFSDELYTAKMAATACKKDSIEAVRKHLDRAANFGLLERMLYVDTKTWLPDDLLIKADKMTMANSVELRVPFLDHKVLEFAASLPRNQKVRGLTMKYLAKKALKKHVPEEILKRRKAGFPVPYGGWLRTNLRDHVRELLLDPVSKARGYFQPKTVEELIRQHEGGRGFSKEIFALVVLELWHRTFADGLPTSEPLPFSGSLGHLKNAPPLSPTETTSIGGLV